MSSDSDDATVLSDEPEQTRRQEEMEAVTRTSEVEVEEPYVTEAKEARRLKRLTQLAFAREKAAQAKRHRAAPKKEIKRLENEIKERLYQEDLEKVQLLKFQMKVAADEKKQKPTRKNPVPSSKLGNDPYDRHHSRRDSLDDLVNILYT